MSFQLKLIFGAFSREVYRANQKFKRLQFFQQVSKAYHEK